MRSIGTLDKVDQAERFVAYLISQRIDAEAEHEGDSTWTIWVRDEDHIETAREMLDAFRENPDDAQYREAVAEAEKVRREALRKQREAGKNMVDMRQRWRRGEAAPTPLTRWLTILCVGITVAAWFGSARGRPNFIVRTMRLYDPIRQVDPARPFPQTRLDYFDDVLHGEVWRLFTPMFLHGDVIHLVFNMLILNWFGKMIESRRGTGTLALIVLISSPVATIVQVWFPAALGGAAPGIGFSGVGYALFGYVWIGATYDHRRDLFITPSAVMFLLAWLLLGTSGLLDQLIGAHIANGAHFGGLLVGMTMAYLAARRH